MREKVPMSVGFFNFLFPYYEGDGFPVRNCPLTLPLMYLQVEILWGSGGDEMSEDGEGSKVSNPKVRSHLIRWSSPPLALNIVPGSF
jgi:hypothetical protein